MNRRKPIPILLAVRELDLGGIERDVTKIAIHLDRERFEPHVVSYHDHGIRFEELKRAGIPVVTLPIRSLYSMESARSALRVWRYVRRHGIRLIHAWDSSCVFFVPLARLFRVPVVLSSMLGSRLLLDSRTRSQLRWTDKMVDSIVVNCEEMRRHMTEDEGVVPLQIQLCYNGFDTREFNTEAPFARPAQVQGASLVIGAVCALRQEKALDILQQAFAIVRHLDPGMRLLIVGSGPELQALQANCQRLGIQDATVFVPATSQVPVFLRGIDIFVLCSHSEAFSNALIEALACGCCAVGTRVGGIPELIGRNEERGLLCNAADPADLAAKLETLIRNPDLRRVYGARGAAFARDNLSIEAACARIGAIYDSFLSQRNVI